MDYYLYLDKDTIFHRLDPRTKLFMLFVGFAIPWMFSDFIVELIILVFVFLWVFAAKAFDNIKRIGFLLVIFILTSVVMWSILGGKEANLFGFISAEGALYGLAMGLKVNAMILSGTIFLSTTRNEEISLALTKLGIPYKISFIFSLAIRLVPLVAGAGTTILQAQRSRGLDTDSGNVFQRVKKYVPLIVPMLISTIRGTDDLGMALESKAFGAVKTRTFFLKIQMKKWDYIFLAIALILFVGALYLKIQGFGQGMAIT